MKCPKCHADFERISTPVGEVDRCLSCQGLWLDMLEHKQLKDIADTLDIGDPIRGKEYNRIGDIDCPVCPNSKMLKMVDAGQPHIWFESCPTCYGRFYDAGEFKDYSEHTFFDWIKTLVAKERK